MSETKSDPIVIVWDRKPQNRHTMYQKIDEASQKTKNMNQEKRLKKHQFSQLYYLKETQFQLGSLYQNIVSGL